MADPSLPPSFSPPPSAPLAPGPPFRSPESGLPGWPLRIPATTIGGFARSAKSVRKASG